MAAIFALDHWLSWGATYCLIVATSWDINNNVWLIISLFFGHLSKLCGWIDHFRNRTCQFCWTENCLSQKWPCFRRMTSWVLSSCLVWVVPSHYIIFRYWPKFLKADIWLALMSIRNIWSVVSHMIHKHLLQTKQSLCIQIELNSCRISWGHQHGHRSFVQGHQHGCHEVT